MKILSLYLQESLLFLDSCMLFGHHSHAHKAIRFSYKEYGTSVISINKDTII